MGSASVFMSSSKDHQTDAVIPKLITDITEREEPKQNGVLAPLIKSLHFCEIKENKSL